LNLKIFSAGFINEIVQLPVVVSFDEDVYIAKCPTIQGAFAQGETPEDAVKELINVIQMIKEYRKERGDFITRRSTSGPKISHKE